MPFKISIFLFVLFSTVESTTIFHPVSTFHIVRSSYEVSYDGRHKNPDWVYECLTAENLSGSESRKNCIFREDDALPDFLRATLIDYKYSGFDRGHLAPAANHKYSSIALNDTFYLSNICPQCSTLNRVYWLQLERFVRDLTNIYSKIHVISGPLYLPYTDADGKRYVKYQVIGQNDVAVPTHFFKIIIAEDSESISEIQAYILPNSQCIEGAIEQFKSTVQKIEKYAGFTFPFLH